LLYDCDRCGRTCLSIHAVEKALFRGKTPLCRDCQTNRLFRVQYETDYCVPHQGFFNLDDYPVTDAGQVIYTDEPTCGHRDCVRQAHHSQKAVVPFVIPSHARKPKPTKGKTPKRANAKHIDYSLIMALAEAQDFNYWVKVGVK
jgi:hypothetical protein